MLENTRTRLFSFLGMSLLSPLLAAALPAGEQTAGEESLRSRARAALDRATTYFRSRVSVEGSYLWTYSADLKERRGEVDATATQGWVQPPGTPTVGMAYLDAYEATREARYLQAARETAHALARTQLVSGGWDYRIEFDPEQRQRWLYRVDLSSGDLDRGARRNTTTFDDDTTQSALRFLMRADEALSRRDRIVRRTVKYGLEKALEAQYPNGGWPQRWDGTPRPAGRYAVRRARFPESWPREHPRQDYRSFCTLNDNVIRDLVETLFVAHGIYGEDRFVQAARRAGDFLVLAQMPDPQPAWAQQYSFDMEPTWARRFEPPSVVSGESVGAIRALLDIYLYTGEEKYREPVRRAVAWMRRSRLDGGVWARFYELRTNRPLYFDKQYRLVYTDDDMPTHYSFQSTYGIPDLLAYVEELETKGRDRMRAERAARESSVGREERRRRANGMKDRIEKIIAALDDEGRWLENGRISSATFCRNVGVLAESMRSAE